MGQQKTQNDKMLALRLAKETGITQNQARELIRLIGTNWNSLLRKGRH
ncbi:MULTISPECIES: hypothetical protein [unclassified Mesorhizobium]|nr:MULTISPECIES: hypothetical protein [unclassified Mesorhizobium]